MTERLTNEQLQAIRERQEAVKATALKEHEALLAEIDALKSEIELLRAELSNRPADGTKPANVWPDRW